MKYSPLSKLLHAALFVAFAAQNTHAATGVTLTGTGALSVNTGNYNSAFGYNTLHANTTAVNNTGVGALALTVNTTGGNNTGVGFSALKSNTSASFNTALGASALFANTTGPNNTGLGYQTLLGNTTGHENTAAGSGAFSTAAAASLSVALGYQALRSSGTAILEVYKVSGASGWSVQYRVETKNAEDPDSAATSLGSVNITAAGTHRAQFSGCLELVRVRYICTGGGTDRWIHMRSNPIQWQPN